MLPTTNTMLSGFSGGQSQVIENNGVNAGEAESGGTFSDYLAAPDSATYLAEPTDSGEALPLHGIGLPVELDPLNIVSGGEESGAEIDLPGVDLTGVFTDPEFATSSQSIAAGASETALELSIDGEEDPLLVDGELAVSTRIDIGAQALANDADGTPGNERTRTGSDPFLRPLDSSFRRVASNSDAAASTEVLSEVEVNLARKENEAASRPLAQSREDTTLLSGNRVSQEDPAGAIPVHGLKADGLEVVQKPNASIHLNGGIHTPALAELSTRLAPSQSAPTTPLTVTAIDVPVLDESWGNALQERVMWLTGRNIQNAEIRLNPSELGPIRVQISVQDDAAQLTFTAQHSLTREAIETAMPRLREMLNENGLSLAGSDVSAGDESDVQTDQHADEEAVSDVSANIGDTADDVAVTSVRQVLPAGLVDTFA